MQVNAFNKNHFYHQIKTGNIFDLSILRQFLLSEILAHNNPLSIHVIAHDYTNPQQIHAAAFYQRPQIKHDADLLVSTPYGLVESPSLQNPFDLNDRYKRNTRMNN